MMDSNGLNRRKVLDIRLLEAHTLVADLQKGETLLLSGHCLIDGTEQVWHAGRGRPKFARARQGHVSFKQNEQRLANTPYQGWVQS
jgi:hypothetical protein